MTLIEFIYVAVAGMATGWFLSIFIGAIVLLFYKHLIK